MSIVPEPERANAWARRTTSTEPGNVVLHLAGSLKRVACGRDPEERIRFAYLRGREAAHLCKPRGRLAPLDGWARLATLLLRRSVHAQTEEDHR